MKFPVYAFLSLVVVALLLSSCDGASRHRRQAGEIEDSEGQSQSGSTDLDVKDGEEDDEDGGFFSSFGQIPRYFHNMMTKMREILHRATKDMQEFSQNLPTKVNETTSEIVEIDGKKYRVDKTLIEKGDNTSMVIYSSVNYVPLDSKKKREIASDH